MISIIIRTYNEEKWIGMCLKAVASQEINLPFEIIIVDSKSSDNTVKRAQQVAKEYKLDVKFLSYVPSKKGYKPGESLNFGWKNSNGNYLVFLSAHCIPSNKQWLSQILEPIFSNISLVSYGRQVPTPFSSLTDKRDLINQFSIESRIQKKDFFFHNANSCIKRSLLEKFEFDEEVSNIEDRVWSKKIISQGYKIAYQADAVVFHYHGINQDNNENRLRGVINILEENILEKISYDSNFNSDIAIIINTSKKDLESKYADKVVNSVIKTIKNSRLVKDIYWFVPNVKNFIKLGFKIPNTFQLVEKEKQDEEINIFELTFKQVSSLENKEKFYDFFVFLETCYLDRPTMVIDEIIKTTIMNGYDKCVAGVVENRPLFLSIREGVENTQINKNNYSIGLPSLCRISTAHKSRNEIFEFENCGILKLNDFSYALKDINEFND
ncbi:glycosyltransferase [Candidatus Pelagibacter sp. HIMB1695]|uniref:glycosyltransferase n=1 Tax=Candidatus Pelagibacter sp. HIMB1695 TaxID=3413364 RepID=UPI003F82FCFC